MLEIILLKMKSDFTLHSFSFSFFLASLDGEDDLDCTKCGTKGVIHWQKKTTFGLLNFIKTAKLSNVSMRKGIM